MSFLPKGCGCFLRGMGGPPIGQFTTISGGLLFVPALKSRWAGLV